MSDSLPKLHNDTIDVYIDGYYKQLQSVALGALRGRLNEVEFRQSLRSLNETAVIQAFIIGGGDIQANRADREIEQQRQIILNSINKLGNDIYNGRYSKNDTQAAIQGRDMLDRRPILWSFAIARMYHTGQEYSRPIIEQATGRVIEPVYKWFLGATEQHCDSCSYAASLPAQTAEQWRTLGLRPQSPSLDCGGWRCDCRRELWNGRE